MTTTKGLQTLPLYKLDVYKQYFIYLIICILYLWNSYLRGGFIRGGKKDKTTQFRKNKGSYSGRNFTDSKATGCQIFFKKSTILSSLCNPNFLRRR